MRRITAVLTFALLIACTPAADGPGGGSADAGPAAPPPGPTFDFTCPSGAPSITNGTNDQWPGGVGAGGQPRQFHALIPDVEAGTQLGVVFSWHGIGEQLDDWVAMTRVDNTQADFPFIVITPHDTGMQPNQDPAGLYWDMFYSSPGDENLEAALFESILGCLVLDYPIDTTRLYSYGFSGGAVITNLLQVRYPDLFAATAPMSGAWFSDPDQEALVDPTGRGQQLLPGLGVDWNDMGAGQETVLITHGGAEDTYGMFQIEVINFDDANQEAISYLTENGRNVIDCPHSEGHRLHSGFAITDLVGFFKAHSWHQASPWADGLPEPFSSAGCTFHAASGR
jgi:predicted esterase